MMVYNLVIETFSTQSIISTCKKLKTRGRTGLPPHWPAATQAHRHTGPGQRPAWRGQARRGRRLARTTQFDWIGGCGVVVVCAAAAAATTTIAAAALLRPCSCGRCSRGVVVARRAAASAASRGARWREHNIL